MGNRKKIIFGLIAGIIFIIAFILNLLFPPKSFIRSAHADDSALIDQYGYFVPGNQLQDSDVVVDHLSALKGWIPDDYTYGDMLFDLASSIIGSSTAINSENVDLGIQTIKTILDSNGFWLDTTSGLIKTPAAVHDSLIDFQVHHGYTPAGGPVVGGWYECPFKTDSYFQSNYLRYLDFVEGPSASAPVYVCFYTGSQSGNHFVVFASFVSGQDARVNQYYSSNNGDTWQFSSTGFSLSSTYQGSESLGYYQFQNLNFFNPPYSLFPFYSEYGSVNDALADLFGWDGTGGGGGDPVFNGDVYIDDTIAPINILDVPGNDGRSTSIQRNTDINNNIVNNYGGSNNIVLSPKLEDIPNNNEYELPDYPELPHNLPAVSFDYPEVVANEEISQGLDGLSPLWVTLLTMGGSFIVLKVIL